MKKKYCTNCGTELKENARYCTKCGAPLHSKRKETPIKTRSSKFWVLLFGGELLIIPITIILTIILVIVTLLDQNTITKNSFLDVMSKHDFTVEEIEKDDNQLLSHYVAEKDGIQVEMLEMPDSSIAQEVFQEIEESLEESNYQYIRTQIGHSYKKYEVEIEDTASILALNNNIILHAELRKDHEEEANEMFKELGFRQPKIERVLIIMLIPIIAIILITTTTLWKIFVKAGELGWYAILPLVNFYILTKIIYGKTKYFPLFFIPFIIIFLIPISIILQLHTITIISILLILPASAITLYINIMYPYRLALIFGKDDIFAICNIFFSFILTQIIAFDYSEYKKEKVCDKLFPIS